MNTPIHTDTHNLAVVEDGIQHLLNMLDVNI